MSAIKFNLHLKDFHKAHLLRKHPENETATLQQYRIIIETLGSILTEQAISNGKAIFPVNKWVLEIVKKKKPVYIDKRLSQVAKKRMYAFNDKTDGFACEVHLNVPGKINKSTGMRNAKWTNYNFKATRDTIRVKIPKAIEANRNIIYSYRTVYKRQKEKR